MIGRAFQQFAFLYTDLMLAVNGRWWRAFSVWFHASTWILITYRFDRLMYLLLGRAYGLLRILLLPFLFLTRPWRGQCEIHYKAQIGKGFKILHPELGIVVNGNTIAGDHLTLTGGNCIGGKERLDQGDIRIGNNVSLGVNAVVLGPITVGNNVVIGAGSVVIHDAKDDSILVGVPAKSIYRSNDSQNVNLKK